MSGGGVPGPEAGAEFEPEPEGLGVGRVLLNVRSSLEDLDVTAREEDFERKRGGEEGPWPSQSHGLDAVEGRGRAATLFDTWVTVGGELGRAMPADGLDSPAAVEST